MLTQHLTAGADFKVLYATASALAGKAAGDVAMSGVTSNDGFFVSDPLFGDATYAVEMSKSGFVLTPTSTTGADKGGPEREFNFAAKQLAQVGGSGRRHLPCTCRRLLLNPAQQLWGSTTALQGGIHPYA